MYVAVNFVFQVNFILLHQNMQCSIYIFCYFVAVICKMFEYFKSMNAFDFIKNVNAKNERCFDCSTVFFKFGLKYKYIVRALKYVH